MNDNDENQSTDAETDGAEQEMLAEPALDRVDAMRRRIGRAQPAAGIVADAHQNLERAVAPVTALAKNAQSFLPPMPEDLVRSMDLPGFEIPGMAEANSKLLEAITGSVSTAALFASVVDTTPFFSPIDTTAFFPSMDTTQFFQPMNTTEWFGDAMDAMVRDIVSAPLMSAAYADVAGSVLTLKFFAPVADVISTQSFAATAEIGGWIRSMDLPGFEIPGMAEANSKLLEAITGSVSTAALFASVVDTKAFFPPMDTTAFLQPVDTTEWFGDAMDAMVRGIVAEPVMSAAYGNVAAMDGNGVMDGLQTVFSDLLGRWTGLDDFGYLLAGRGRSAALRARAAALRNDHEVVTEFARRWLGLKRVTRRVLVAVIAALFDPSWEHVEPDLAIPTLKRIRRVEARLNSDLLGSKAKGDLRMHSLDVTGGEFPVALEPLWKPRPERVLYRVEGFDPRVERVLAQLTEGEREIAVAYAMGGRSFTWAQAAVECGQDPRRGQSVRRKLGRLGDRFVQRYAPV
ncbi:hypothetical protein [Nocardia sp. NPDC050710]|uniref:hypothetical protein n=1 Tax=Nocardia sp. NPDC050710 TaxID=3157220 RepID=UPI0033EE60AC